MLMSEFQELDLAVTVSKNINKRMFHGVYSSAVALQHKFDLLINLISNTNLSIASDYKKVPL